MILSMINVKYILFIASLLSIISCSKSSSDKDKTAPAVVISTPANNQVFTGGQTITITGTVTDAGNIAELHMHITNIQTGALLVDIHRNPASSNYALNETFIAQSGIEYKIQVIAKDNAANEGRSTVNISVN